MAAVQDGLNLNQAGRGARLRLASGDAVVLRLKPTTRRFSRTNILLMVTIEVLE